MACPLAVDPLEGAYTDGSCIEDQGGPNRLGAAVRYVQGTAVCTMFIKPQGRGTTNTINRAELSAIHFAVCDTSIARNDEDLVIYTDSLCCIQLVNKMQYTPASMADNKHLLLVEAITARILVRTRAGG